MHANDGIEQAQRLIDALTREIGVEYDGLEALQHLATVDPHLAWMTVELPGLRAALRSYRFRLDELQDALRSAANAPASARPDKNADPRNGSKINL